MKKRFWLCKRGQVYYALDSQDGRRVSLRTDQREDALKILQAKNDASGKSGLGLALAKAYLGAYDESLNRRTWQAVMDAFCSRGQPQTQAFRRRKLGRQLFDSLRTKCLLETTAEDFRQFLSQAGVMDHAILRSLHNLALGYGWLPWPVLAAKLWPPLRAQPKRGITQEEHERIQAAEKNRERRLYYDLLWETGASQTDAARLQADNIDWPGRMLTYQRKKTGTVAHLSVGSSLEAILKELPKRGPLFPSIIRITENARSAEFWRRCKLLRIQGVTLHSFRYAWAERARSCGYPERFAQEALGHNSKAVHRAYAKGASVKIPALDEFESGGQSSKPHPLPPPEAKRHSTEVRPQTV